MHEETDLSFLDQPEILGLIFFPRRDTQIEPLPPHAKDHQVEVGPGVEIGCRFYQVGQDLPTVLYFHGNGEIASDHDFIAPFFNERGINLFVADYRGYGWSDGNPSCTSLLRDSHPIFRGFQKILREAGCEEVCFVMGRSIGCVPAIELAFHCQDELKGLIIESGFADSFELASRFLGIGGLREPEGMGFANLKKISRLHIPLLIIHGEFDQLIPLQQGKELYEKAGGRNKRMVVIRGGGHNDLLLVGQEEYFKALEEFVRAYSP